MASLYKKRGFYFIDFWVGNKRKTINTQLKITSRNLKKVEKIKADIEKEVEIKKTEIKERSYEQSAGYLDENKEQLTISEHIEKYRIKLSIRSKSHQEVFEYAMARFQDIVPGDFSPKEVTPEHIIRYIKLHMNIVSNATLITYLNYLKAFFNYLVDEDYILKTPIRTKDLPKRARKAITTFPKEMLYALLEESLRRDYTFYCILKMLGFTAIRPIDLLNLKVGDLDFDKNSILVRMSKVSNEIKFPLYDELKEFLFIEMKEVVSKSKEEYLFPGYSVARVGRKFRRIKLKLGILDKHKYTLRTFRKTFATLYAKTLHIQDVANLLGHDDIETTKEFYTDVITEDLRNKLNQKK
ncbi:MAG: tyrosine-type recombinase/integrase [Bacteroidetes bacterium]|nr:tyrosine-type recombinase/integrase [Bacteroidota bacterium]